jgi:putative heme-binding domain-containing protein
MEFTENSVLDSRSLKPHSKNLFSVALCVLCASVLSFFGSSATAADSKWIWTSDAAEPGNDPQFVRASCDLPDDVVKATYTITCDNSYAAFVNGKQVGAGKEWKDIGVYDVSGLLYKGKNVIGARAQNAGGKAGLLAELSVTLKNGKTVKFSTDKSWVFSTKEEKDWSTAAFAADGWKTCTELGNWDSAPWNLTAFGAAGGGGNTAGPKPVADPGAPPDPEIERQSFQVADGFEVNLFAADPMLAKPVQMNFDAGGRLWLVASATYPMIKPGEAANDKVIVLEDTDGDGKADKTRVFAEGLLIPTGIEPGDGGAYVANSTEMIHLKDTDGDGKADQRRTVLSGFGTEDTHHIVHTFRWGEDGNLYFNQSIYIHSHIETPWGTKRLFSGGIWRFRPKTYELDVFLRGLCNTWGHHIDTYGQSFATDGCGGGGMQYVIPGCTYEFYQPGGKQLPGLNPGSPKYAGCEILSGRHIPDDWQGHVLTNDFRAHRTVHYQLNEDGSGFSSKPMPDLIKTRDNAYRPIDIKMGPDGAIYIADWFNPIINHGEVDFYDPRRDRTHGRIWRVTAKGRPLVQRPKLEGASTKELLEQLKSPENWTRHFAKRVLSEKDPKEVAAALPDFVKSLPTDAANEQTRLEALWTYQTIDIPDAALLKQVLVSSTNPKIRAAAVRVAGLWAKRVPETLDLLNTAVQDEFPRVRLEAVRALPFVNTPEAFAAALRVLDKPMDRFLDYCLTLTANEMRNTWAPALESGKLTLTNPKHSAFALQAIGSAKAVQDMITKIGSGKLSPEEEDRTLEAIAGTGGSDDMVKLMDIAAGTTLNDAQCAKALDAIQKAINSRAMKPPLNPAKITALLDARKASEVCTAAGFRLAGSLNLDGLRPRLEAAASSADTPARVRRQAIDAIAHFGGAPSAALLTKLAGPENALDVRLMAIGGLSGIDAKAAATLAVDILAMEKSDLNGVSNMFYTFSYRIGAPDALAAALSGKKITQDAAKVGIRVLQSRAATDSPLAAALKKAGGLDEEKTAFSKEEMAALISEAASKGDPARGEAIFRRKETSCQKCHAIGGVGGQVGPDLQSIGASAPVDYIIDSLYFPNKAVKENYNSVIAITKDAKVFTGIKVRQTDKELILRDANAEDISVPLANIKTQRAAGSIMPAGLMDPLTRAETLDLVRFISELGKPGPFAMGTTPLARRWLALQATDALDAKTPTEQLAAAAKKQDASFSMIYSAVSGALPLKDVPATKDSVSVLRTYLDVSTGGKLSLKLDNADGVSVAVDGAATEAKGEIALDLKPGLHVILFVVDRAKRNDTLRLELGEVAGSGARAQFTAK